MPYELTDEQRDRYRATSIRAQLRKQALLRDHDEHALRKGSCWASGWTPTT